jgi:hypothetical protein
MRFRVLLTIVVALIIATTTTAVAQDAKRSGFTDFETWEWNVQNPAAQWAPRAGLQAVKMGKRLYVMGGRTPLDPAVVPVPGASVLWGDVWASDDLGETWDPILFTDDDSHWPARAYFQAVTKGRHMYVLGGQNFTIVDNECPPFVPDCPAQVPQSEFFNDVWRSRDGINWRQMTEAAPWAGRAGLSAVVHRGVIYVMGGSYNDDSSIVGEQPERVYFNDVWKSYDGAHWVRLTEAAPWAPRAGAIVVSNNGHLYLIGGEDGFTCESGDRCPPYYNDVWRSRDGRNWQLVTDAAPWPARPGHQAVVVQNRIVLFGGFGLSTDPSDPFKPSNPMDVWVSKNGRDWLQVSDSPWNAGGPEDIKYDFDALVVKGSGRGWQPTILTFGGDRETFNFFDPFNYLNVDNDVWKFAAPRN